MFLFCTCIIFLYFVFVFVSICMLSVFVLVVCICIVFLYFVFVLYLHRLVVFASIKMSEHRVPQAGEPHPATLFCDFAVRRPTTPFGPNVS